MSRIDAREDEEVDRVAWSAWPVKGRALGHLLIAYVVLVAVGLGLGGLILHSPIGEPVVDEDVEISEWIAAEREPILTEISEWASLPGATIPVVAIVGILFVGFVLAFKRWLESATLVTALSLEALVFVTVSTLVGRSRPPIELLDPAPPTASFPSGHVGAATALYLTVATIVWWRTDNVFLRGLAAIVAVVLPVSVALSRMYRGMHFLTDVIVGVILGAAAAWVAIRVVRTARERQAT